MKTKPILFIALLTAFAGEANAQGFGIGSSSPNQLLHLAATGTSNTAVQFDCQTTAGTSSASYSGATNGTVADNGGSYAWTNPGGNVLAVSDATVVSYIATSSVNTNYIKFTNLNITGISGTVTGISVTVDRNRTADAPGTQVTLLSGATWNRYSTTGGSASVTVTSANLTGGTTSPFAITSGPNRLLIFTIHHENNNSNTAETVSSVTYGGQAMTQANNLSYNTGSGRNVRNEVWYLKESGITAATGTSFVVTWSGNTNTDELYSAALFGYVDQTTPIGTTTSVATGSVNPIPVPSLTPAAGDAILLSCTESDPGATTSLATYTAAYNFDDASPDFHAGAVYKLNLTAGATGVRNLVATSSSSRQVGLGTVIKFAAATPAATDYSVKLIKGGTISGNDKVSGTTWTTGAFPNTQTYGSSSDLWGLSWAPADINSNANFGVAIAATASYTTVQITQITVTVTYVPSGNFSNYVMGVKQSNGNFMLSKSTAFGTNDWLTVLSSNGNVGINTTSPGYKLDVQGGDINASGSVRSAGTALTSDIRLKRDIRNFENGIGSVMKLRPVTYLKKTSLDANDYTKNEIGFIAQEIQTVFPQLVTEGTDYGKILAVDYNSLIPVLTKAIQEQQKIIDELNLKVILLTESAESARILELRVKELEASLKPQIPQASK